MPDSTVNAVEKIAQACDVQQPCGSIGPGRFKQDVVRLVPAQDVNGQGFQRRDVERVEAGALLGAGALGEAHQAWQESSKRLSRSCGSDQQRGAAFASGFEKR
jgi:hypothetical protein